MILISRTSLSLLAVLALAMIGAPAAGEARAAVTCDGHVATLVGTPRADTLVGTPRRDIIAGLGGSDVIHGRGGDDLICAGLGNDEVVGEGGDDRIFGGAGLDGLHGYAGDDRLRGGSGPDFLDPRQDTNVAWGGPGDDTFRLLHADAVHGGAGNDVMVLDHFQAGPSHVLDGGAGSNRLELLAFRRDRQVAWGRVLVDLRSGDFEADGTVWTLAGRFDRLVAYRSAAELWNIYGTHGADVVDTRNSVGNVVVFGRAGDDIIRTWDGADELHGGAGDDTLSAGAGDDTLRGGRDTDRADAGDGTDTCFSIEGPLSGHTWTSCETSNP